MKKYLLLLLLVSSISCYAQQTINNYKYVIVPAKFTFLTENDQYKLNSLAKLFLEEKGFKVYFDNAELPAEIKNNKCNVLNFDVVNRKSMLSTNLTLFLKDGKENIFFKSKEGKSREKEYRVSYNAALRDAFTSLNDVQYSYIESQKEVIANKVGTIVANKPVEKTIIDETAKTSGVLYAQSTSNGYQLIDTTPKKVLTLFKTSVADYFIAENGAIKGMIFKYNGVWFFEYYKNDQLVSEKLNIKF